MEHYLGIGVRLEFSSFCVVRSGDRTICLQPLRQKEDDASIPGTPQSPREFSRNTAVSYNPDNGSVTPLCYSGASLLWYTCT